MYREKLTVMPSETACTNEIKIRALLNRLQDTASLAVMDNDGSPGDLIRRGYGWVLLRYQLKVERRLPAMDEAIVIETRHTVNDGFHTLRAFRVFARANEAETLILARTSWVLIDLAAGRPVRALQRLPEVFRDVADDPPIDPEFASIPKLNGPALKDAPVLRETDFPVRFHDLDANGHVNNAVYFEWMYEATPLDLMDWQVREADAEFRISLKYGETARVRVKAADHADSPDEKTRAFVYDMTRADGDGHSVARFYAVWAVS
ncbi:MAG: thioesterase [Synergistaceae bacterium]|nr:thioesterase [Synergistaceae bacterium]